MPVINKRCVNTVRVFTCPKCNTDHKIEVRNCKKCGASLKCYSEKVVRHYCELDVDNPVSQL